MLKSKLLIATAVALTIGLGSAASMAVAQQPSNQNGKPDTGMMCHQCGMMGMMMDVDPAQMKRMVENCNRMMEGMMQNMPAAGPEKKG